MMYRKQKHRFWRHLLALPFIYLMVLPGAVTALYLLIHKLFAPKRHSGIDMSQYIRVDRQRLKYLNMWEKVGCAYCGFINGVLNYSTAVVRSRERPADNFIVKFLLGMCDLFLMLYVVTSYRLYRLPKLKRSDYIKDDYLAGLLFLAVVVAANTELYFCGIRHEKYKGFKEPKHHKNFVKYGDEKALVKRYGP